MLSCIVFVSGLGVALSRRLPGSTSRYLSMALALVVLIVPLTLAVTSDIAWNDEALSGIFLALSPAGALICLSDAPTRAPDLPMYSVCFLSAPYLLIGLGAYFVGIRGRREA
jgi:hypothetical protein